MPVTPEEMLETTLYAQEIHIFYPTEWGRAHATQRELITVIEKFFKDHNLEIVRLGYGVRPLWSYIVRKP
jgi:hypothetical protein